MGRLTDNSGTVRVLFHSDVKAYVSYGEQSGRLSSKTAIHSLRAGTPYDFVIDSLAKNTRYFYRVMYQADGPHSALFLGNLKLMKFYEEGRMALFDIATDISEQNDLSERMPQKVKELDTLLVTAS